MSLVRVTGAEDSPLQGSLRRRGAIASPYKGTIMINGPSACVLQELK